MTYIDELIVEKLGGDGNKVANLFHDDAIFAELIARAKNSDWYHFEPKTYDGAYFVKTVSGYDCYLQDRGSKSNFMSFDEIHEAATYYFTQAGYIKVTQKKCKKWWQFCV